MTEIIETDRVEAKRIARLLETLRSKGVPAYVVTKGSDIKYLTGFTGEYGTAVLVVSDAGRHLVTDGRFESQAAREVGDVAEVHVYRKWTKGAVSNYFTVAGDILADLGVAEAGVVAADLSLAAYGDLSEHARGVRLVQVEDLVAPLRMIKSGEELDAIRQACKISMLSFYALLDSIRPGVTEREVAAELEHQFHLHGGDGYCFDTIVASGPQHGACPHSTVSDRKLESGDFVTIDFGTYYHGYCSDITRTLVLGKARDARLREIWDIVQGAKDAAEAALAPGASLAAVSCAATDYVRARGYDVPHGIGHGFGLDIHEAPNVSPRSEVVASPGMVHTIEPGIYVPELGGVRQEDDYLVTENGFERLTFITDKLIEL